MPTAAAPHGHPGLDDATVLEKLGPLAGFSGKWQGTGFNIAAHPDFAGNADVRLDLNLTADTITFDPIPAVINNRGYTQADIEMFGLTYLQHSIDTTGNWPIHAEPGMWISLPATTRPADEPPQGGRLVTRMFSVPHGASFVAQGFALPFSGPPTIDTAGDPADGNRPAFSCFPSFNTTPLTPAFPAAGSAVAAAGTSGRFSSYTVANSPGLPAPITQQLVDDPVTLLQQTIKSQVAEGYQFEGVAINVATASAIRFQSAGADGPEIVSAPQFGGGIADCGFLRGVSTAKPNLAVSLVYSTFWLEQLTHPDGRPPEAQLQYAQSALLNFPVRSADGEPNTSWPHVSVSTLRRVR